MISDSTTEKNPEPGVFKQFALKLFPRLFSDSSLPSDSKNESTNTNPAPTLTKPPIIHNKKPRAHTNSVVGHISPFKLKTKKLDEDQSPILRRRSRGYSLSPKNSSQAENKVIKLNVEKKSKTNQDLKGFHKELVANEIVIAFKDCVLMPPSPQSQLDPINGFVIITNFRIVFKVCLTEQHRIGSSNVDYFEIFSGSILKLERSRDKTKSNFVYLDISSQNDFVFHFRIREDRDGGAGFLLHYLDDYSFPKLKDNLFAFEHFKNPQIRELEKRFKGSKIYNIEREFERQGIAFEPFTERDSAKNLVSGSLYPYQLVDNRLGQICSSYPPLLLVPSKLTHQDILNSIRFRNRDRIPVITYHCSKTGAILARSSQPRNGAIVDDELVLRYLENPFSNTLETTPTAQPGKNNFYICNAQPFSPLREDGNAMRQLNVYKNNKVYQLTIEDIHYVRHAHRKLINLCSNLDNPNFKWYSQLEASHWLKDLSNLILAARKIASLLRKGKNCLVECNNGSDRSSQLVSLAQIIADPYYRTIKGFQVLIAKDWCYFGHQFYTRNAAEINQSDNKKSPIFLQFLDCVHQLANQYPFAFEFNHGFLLEIARHIYSRQFGTFLSDSYQELNLYKFEDKTLSLWSYLNSTKEKFLNPHYKTFGSKDWFLLRATTHLKHMKLWEEYFLQYSWIPKPAFEIEAQVSFCKNDFYERICIEKSQEVQDLKKRVQELKDKVLKIEEQKIKKEEELLNKSLESDQGSRFFDRLSLGSQEQDQMRLSKSMEEDFNEETPGNEDFEFHLHEV